MDYKPLHLVQQDYKSCEVGGSSRIDYAEFEANNLKTFGYE